MNSYAFGYYIQRLSYLYIMNWDLASACFKLIIQMVNKSVLAIFKMLYLKEVSLLKVT